jgi:small-conductance mechanosensitive channel
MAGRSILDTINNLIIETEVKLISSVILLVLIWLLRTILLRILFQRIKDPRNQGLARQIIGYTAFLLGVILIGRLWLEGFQSLLIVLTLVLAALIMSLKELILNLASWSVIAWRQLFNIGDRIKIGNHYGEVEEMGIIYITLLELDEKIHSEPTGQRVVRVPNSLVLTQPIINYTHGAYTLWYNLTVSLRLDSDWQEAKRLLADILQEKTVQDETGLPRDISITLAKTEIILTGYYLCDSTRHLKLESAIWEAVLSAFQHHAHIHLN